MTDDTITKAGAGVEKSAYDWIMEAKKLGYKICILSNTANLRKVKRLMSDLGVNGLGFARKPKTKGFEMALNLLDLKKEEVIMVGDQILTDVVGANRFGIKSILVKPISKIEWPHTIIKRPIEHYLLRKIRKEMKND